MDEYLQNEANQEMNLEAFFDWKKKESKTLRETKNESDKKSWLERKKNYLHIKNKYNKCIAAAKEYWILSKDGVVNGLCYNPKKCQYEATIKYMDENNMQKEAEMMVSYAWIVKEYGAVLANKLRDVAENNYFLKPPLDRKGNTTYFQHEGKHIV